MLLICGYVFYKNSTNSEAFNEQTIEDIDAVRESVKPEIKDEKLTQDEKMQICQKATKVLSVKKSVPVKQVISKTIPITSSPKDKVKISVKKNEKVVEDINTPVEITEEYKPEMSNAVFYRGVFYNIKVKNVADKDEVTNNSNQE